MRPSAAFLLALLLPALAAGCTSIYYEFGQIAAGSGRFGDRDPHAWATRTPWSYPVHGVDVSKYQEAIDWRTLRGQGIAFAFIKATEGGDRVDDRFDQNWRGARAAGIPRGAYHFYYFCRPAAEQAEWFIRNVPKESAALPPVIDMEWNPASPTCKLRPAPETVRAEMRVMIDRLAAHYGKRPIIYTTIDFFQDNGLAVFRNDALWLRSVAGHPQEKYGRLPWSFWQYTGTGIVPGIKGDADLNAFNGNEAEWRRWLKANAN